MYSRKRISDKNHAKIRRLRVWHTSDAYQFSEPRTNDIDLIRERRARLKRSLVRVDAIQRSIRGMKAIWDEIE